jgi:predicted short-subunit dehydrogenase-like oxidoreductase (DUF2520 family)
MQLPSAHITPIPPITLIGAGRVGGSIHRALLAAGTDARLLGRDEVDGAGGDAEVILLCVPDGEIETACRRAVAAAPRLRFAGHTSGSTPLAALDAAARAGAACFSLHPLQTVPDAATDLTGAPAAIAGNKAEATALGRAIADRCQMVPFDVPEESRAAYHAAAAIASNFLVALEASAEELLEGAGIDDARELLAPLVLRTAANWAERGEAALTGPIARGDEATVARHLEAIGAAAPRLLPLYEALAERTREIAASREPR